MCLQTASLDIRNPDGKDRSSPLDDMLAALGATPNFTVVRLIIECELDESASSVGRRVLNMFCGTTEILHLQAPVSLETIESIGLASINFPRLSDLRFGLQDGPILMHGLVPYGQNSELLEKIVDNAPNLKRIDSYLTPEWCNPQLVEKLQNRGLVVSFTCDIVRASPWDTFTRGLSDDDLTGCLEFAKKGPMLEKLVFSNIPTNPVRFGCGFQAMRYSSASRKIQEIREMLLRNNADRLKSLEIAHNDLQDLLTKEQTPVFRSLKTLIVHVASEVANDGNFFANADLASYFPRLEEVELQLHYSSTTEPTGPQCAQQAPQDGSARSSKTVRLLNIRDLVPKARGD